MVMVSTIRPDTGPRAKPVSITGTKLRSSLSHGARKAMGIFSVRLSTTEMALMTPM